MERPTSLRSHVPVTKACPAAPAVSCTHSKGMLLTSAYRPKKPGAAKAKKSKQVSQKYTAARLHEKGVLIEIDDLQTNQ